MSIGTILGISLFTVAGALLLRRYNPTYALILSAAGGCALLIGVLPACSQVIQSVERFLDRGGINREFLSLLLKALGICYICQFAADLCRDAGETAMAGHVELAGKIMTVAISFPMILEVVNTIVTLIDL